MKQLIKSFVSGTIVQKYDIYDSLQQILMMQVDDLK